jgi:hypothetical protein
VKSVSHWSVGASTMILALVGTSGRGFAATRGDVIAHPQDQRAGYQRGEREVISDGEWIERVMERCTAFEGDCQEVHANQHNAGSG